MFKRLFGKTIKDKTLDYPAAIRKIQELQKAGAEPIKLKIRQSAARPIVETRPSFEIVLEQISIQLAPYQYEANPRLKGDTIVRDRTKDFGSFKKHFLILYKP